MRKLLAILTLCCCLQLHAQSINVGDRFMDNETGVTYIVRDVRMDKYVYMADETEENLLSLTKVDGRQGEYILEPSRQADDPPIAGAKFGWPVKYTPDKGSLEFYTPQGKLLYTLVAVKVAGREDYRFDVSFGPDSEGYIGRIFVKAYTPQSDEPAMEFERDLVERLAEAASTPWGAFRSTMTALCGTTRKNASLWFWTLTKSAIPSCIPTPRRSLVPHVPMQWKSPHGPTRG